MEPGPALGKPSVCASALDVEFDQLADALAELPALDDENWQPDIELPPPGKWQRLRTGKKLLPDHRIQFCHSKVAFGRQSVDLMKKNDSVYFAGVHRCGSVWACPVCSARISEGRRRELQKAIDKAVGQGHGVSLATYTFSHGVRDALGELLPKFRAALRRLKSGRQWQRIQQQFGIVGMVKALEVTHGKNGWHPHEHQLVFTKELTNEATLREMQAAIFPLWLEACRKAGLPLPNAEHGLQIQGAKDAAQYVGKFGFASELTRSQSKRGKLAGRTQWDLLDDYAMSNGTDLRAGELFKEYVEVFAGARQLMWSRGLREWLQLGELFSDAQLAEPDEPDAKLMVELDLDTWALITRFDWHEDVVEKAKLGRDALLEFLNWIRSHCPLWNGRIVGPKSRDEWRPDLRKRSQQERERKQMQLISARRRRGRRAQTHMESK